MTTRSHPQSGMHPSHQQATRTRTLTQSDPHEAQRASLPYREEGFAFRKKYL